MRIYVKEIRLSGRFEARLTDPNGELIVESSRTPLLDSARVLKARGKTGKLEMWGGSPPKLRMSAEIAEAAKLTVWEDGETGPRFVKIPAKPFNSPANA
jgi:hypothetical protein